LQKGKFLAAEKFALLPALKRCSREALQCRLEAKAFVLMAAQRTNPLFSLCLYLGFNLL
jgi:hypothetical protein